MVCVIMPHRLDIFSLEQIFNEVATIDVNVTPLCFVCYQRRQVDVRKLTMRTATLAESGSGSAVQNPFQDSGSS